MMTTTTNASIWNRETNMAIVRQTMLCVYFCMCKKSCLLFTMERCFFSLHVYTLRSNSDYFAAQNGLWMNEKLHNFHKTNMTLLFAVDVVVGFYECLTLLLGVHLYDRVYIFSSLLYCIALVARTNLVLNCHSTNSHTHILANSNKWFR